MNDLTRRRARAEEPRRIRLPREGSDSDLEERFNAGAAMPSSMSDGELWCALVPSPAAITSGVCHRNASDRRRTFLGRLKLPWLAMLATAGSLAGDCGTEDSGELEKTTDARGLCVLLLGDALALMGDALLVDALACAVVTSKSVVGGACPLPSLSIRESRFRLGVFLIVLSIPAERADDGTRVP